jgi:hypothetical protein
VALKHYKSNQTKNLIHSDMFPVGTCYKSWNGKLGVLIFGVLTPLSAIFQLYHGDQF